MKWILGLVAGPVALSLAVAEPAFDPRGYQSQVVGEKTLVLVLGTPHLSGTPDGWDPITLEPLLTRLEAFKPDAIAIEALPGRSISQLWDYREVYPDVANYFAGRSMVLAAIARSGVARDMPDAEAEARRTLAKWPKSPKPADRRRLAALFAASGDPASALVQWLRLAPAERIADDSATALFAEQLTAYQTRKNENNLIAAPLAARLGLERVYPMDDQSDDVGATFLTDFEPFAKQPWYKEMVEDPRFKPLREASDHLGTPDELLATYRMLNSPETGILDADTQWLRMINRASPNDVGRTRVGMWETRNLRMAANIREVAEHLPRRRLLVIVGSAHNPWFEAYLGMMSDIEIVDAQAVLK
ncbi:MAG: DUF5694 domain-containing protein [Alphaproteobacteria bacterium]